MNTLQVSQITEPTVNNYALIVDFYGGWEQKQAFFQPKTFHLLDIGYGVERV